MSEQVWTMLQRGDAFIVQLARDVGTGRVRIYDAALARLYAPADLDELKNAKRVSKVLRPELADPSEDDWHQPSREVTPDEIAAAEVVEFAPPSSPVAAASM